MNTRPVAATQPDSILDIVFQGYRSAFRHLWPMSRLTLPAVAVYAVGTGYFYTLGEGFEKGAPLPSLPEILAVAFMGLLMLLASLACIYMLYPVLRYVRDAHHGKTGSGENTRGMEDIYAYLLPGKSFPGFIGIGLLWLLLSIPAMMASAIGLLLLVIPGLVVFSYFYTGFGLIYALYMDNPELGVSHAVSECLALLKGNTWRTAGLGFLAWIVYMVMAIPLFVCNVAVEVLGALIPAAKGTVWLGLPYALTLGAMTWFSLTVNYGGLYFILYRFIDDLKLRKGNAVLF